MDLTYTLQSFDPTVTRAYVGLLPEQERDITGGKLDWKFNNNPGGSGLAAIAWNCDTLVGLNAFMAARFRIGGQSSVGYQSMDTIVAPLARGKGAFGKLINRFYAEADAALLYGFPNASSSPGFFNKLGWTSFGPVPMLFRPLRSGYFLRRLGLPGPDIALPLPLRGLGAAANAREVDRFDEEATASWQRFTAGIGCAVERDAAFLNWRLIDHPVQRYNVLAAVDGSFVAWCVADKHDGRIGYIMEAIGEAATVTALIGVALRRMRKARADVALAWCLPHSPNFRSYRRAGLYVLPERLRPITINFGARALHGESAIIGEVSNWYVSYLDSDTV